MPGSPACISGKLESVDEMNDLRNVLIHNYEGADPTLVRGVVDREIPAVLAAVHHLVAEEQS